MCLSIVYYATLTYFALLLKFDVTFIHLYDIYMIFSIYLVHLYVTHYSSTNRRYPYNVSTLSI